MKVTAFIRKTAKKNDIDTKATIYFRLREERKTSRQQVNLSSTPTIGVLNDKVIKTV